jgi:hypothetical protein
MNYKKALLYAIPIVVGGFIIFQMAFAQKPKGRTTPKYDPDDDKGDFPLKLGSSGAKVKELQNALLSKDPNCLPKYGADSDFGSETEAALIKITGKSTVNSQEELDKIKGGTVIKTDNFPLSKGSRGAKVKELQNALLSNDPLCLPKYGADSDFGQETEDALLKRTGRKVVNNQSDLDALKKGGNVVANAFPLSRGSRGAKVKELQLKLLKINPAILPKYGADSDFGKETEDALFKITGKRAVANQAELDAIK